MTWKELKKIIDTMDSQFLEHKILLASKNQEPETVELVKAPDRVYWNKTKWVLLLETEMDEDDKNDDVSILFEKGEYCIIIKDE